MPEEYWVNVYGWYDLYNNKIQTIVGNGQKFKSITEANFYLPSWGLFRLYRIHVKMKPDKYIQAQKDYNVHMNKPIQKRALDFMPEVYDPIIQCKVWDGVREWDLEEWLKVKPVTAPKYEFPFGDPKDYVQYLK